MLHKKGSVLGLVAVIVAALLLVAAVVMVLRISPAPPSEEPGEPPETVAGGGTSGAAAGEAAAVRSVVITDDEVLALLPVKGARLHFVPGNKIKVGHESIPLLQVTIRCGASGGFLWLGGIPSWLDLSRLDSSIDNYCSRWLPAWSFTVDSSLAAGVSVTPQDGICTGDATPFFDWSGIDDGSGDRYCLQVGTDPGFGLPLLTRERIGAPHYQVADDEAFTDGEYCWRLMREGRIWITGMPPWLDISRYDPEVTQIPTVASLETGDGTVKITYIVK